MDVWVKLGNGDQGAYEQVFRYYYKRLYNYGRKFTTNMAVLEDAIQDTLVSLWTSRDRLRRIAKPHSYLLQTFRFILFKKLRRDRNFQPLGGVEPGEPDFGREEILIRQDTDADLRRKLENAMQLLTGRQREAIFLRFYEGLSYEEVAVILEISVKASYKIMSRALSQLRETLSLPFMTVLFLFRGLS